MSTTTTTQNNLSDAELAAYETRKAGWFKGTIAVCVVYGVFALALLAIALFDSRGRQFLSEDFLPFTVTFVAGMIVVIILLVVQITTFKPQSLNTILYDRDICPDYWKAVPATDAEKSVSGSDDDSSNALLMKMKCVPDPDVIALDYKVDGNNITKITSLPTTNNTVQTNIFGQSIVNSDSSSYSAANNKYAVVLNSNPSTDSEIKLSALAPKMYGNVGIGTTAIRCDMLFPAMMAKEDEMNDPENPNQLRCKYAELCGINWSSICS